jgi:hypothetical protein
MALSHRHVQNRDGRQWDDVWLALEDEDINHWKFMIRVIDMPFDVSWRGIYHILVRDHYDPIIFMRQQLQQYRKEKVIKAKLLNSMDWDIISGQMQTSIDECKGESITVGTEPLQTDAEYILVNTSSGVLKLVPFLLPLDEQLRNVYRELILEQFT